jgi:hypothetical protein
MRRFANKLVGFCARALNHEKRRIFVLLILVADAGYFISCSFMNVWCSTYYASFSAVHPALLAVAGLSHRTEGASSAAW